MKLMQIFTISLLLVSYSGVGQAAVPSAMKVISKSILRGDGALQGGQSGGVYSLMDLKKFTHSTAKTERLIIEVGDGSLQKLKGRIGYYNVELQGGKKLILNFTQAANMGFDEKALASKLAKSAFVQKSSIRFDRLAQTTSLVLDLKKTADVRVGSVPGGKQTGRLILDLYESKK